MERLLLWRLEINVDEFLRCVPVFIYSRGLAFHVVKGGRPSDFSAAAMFFLDCFFRKRKMNFRKNVQLFLFLPLLDAR